MTATVSAGQGLLCYVTGRESIQDCHQLHLQHLAAFLNNGKYEQELLSFQQSILKFLGFLVDLLAAHHGPPRGPQTTV